MKVTTETRHAHLIITALNIFLLITQHIIYFHK